MQTFSVVDPHDPDNPINAPGTAGSLMCHGAHSLFSQAIESEGFCCNSFRAAYGAPLAAVVSACDDLHFKPDGYAAAKGFSDRGFVYFTGTFRSARGYAINTGGERIDGALRAAKGFL